MNHKTLGIYIHIPFCVQKCLYCDFISGPASLHIQQDYVNCLLKETDMRTKQPYCLSSEDRCPVETVFIGGGTPSILDADLIRQILCKLKEVFLFSENYECTIEVNPGTVEFDKLKKYREAGINRLSIGLQSCNDNELKALGRIHDYSAFEETYRLARKAGFENINVDLMSSIPEQTEKSFVNSLKKIAELKPEHISVYSLIVEEGTPFFDMNLKLPDEEEERNIYYATRRILSEYGYDQYEISNYAKPGKECRHNIRYWQCDAYLGFGVAAASYLNGVRWKNTEDINQYIQHMRSASINSNLESDDFYCEKELLTNDDKCSEFMFMGLRMNAGISEIEFMKQFGCTTEEKYGDIIEKHIRSGLLRRENQRIQLTDKGRDVCNYVMADFLL